METYYMKSFSICKKNQRHVFSEADKFVVCVPSLVSKMEESWEENTNDIPCLARLRKRIYGFRKGSKKCWFCKKPQYSAHIFRLTREKLDTLSV